MNWNELKDKHFKWACENGQHDTELPCEHWLMLIITEAAECIQADRNNKHTDVAVCKNGDEPFDPIWFERHIKDTVEDELADVILRILDYCGLKQVDLSNLDQLLYMYLDIYNPKCHTQSLTSLCFLICRLLTSIDLVSTSHIPMSLIVCMRYCKINEIDIMWHIEQKMKYNQSRPRLNGKRY